VVGAAPLTPSAEKLRRLMHYGQILQSHALHFFHLSSPDLLFGFDSEAGQRNIVGVAAAYPEVAKQGVLLLKFGQEVIRLTAGKRVHGTGAIPGGVNRALSRPERDRLLAEIESVICWSRQAVQLVKRLHAADPAFYDGFGTFRSNLLSLVCATGPNTVPGKLFIMSNRAALTSPPLAISTTRRAIASAPFSISTSITSRASTMRLAMQPATACFALWPSACTPRCARPICWH